MDSSVLEKIAGFLQDMTEPAVKILPLFLLFGLVKTISSVDNLISKFSGSASKGAAGFGERFSKDLDNRRQLQATQGRGTFGGILGANRRRKERRDNISGGIESELKRSRADYHAKRVEEDEGYRNRVAGGTRFQQADQSALDRALANAINVRAQIDIDEVKAASAIIKNADLDMKAIRELAHGNQAGGLDGSSLAVRRAAMQQVVKANDIEGIKSLTDASLGWSHANDTSATAEQRAEGSKLRASLSEALNDSSARPAWLSKGVIAGIENGTNTQGTTGLIQQAVTNNTYSQQVIAGADKDELAEVAKVIESVDRSSSPELVQGALGVIGNARAAEVDPKLKTVIGKNEAAVGRISGNSLLP